MIAVIRSILATALCAAGMVVAGGAGAFVLRGVAALDGCEGCRSATKIQIKKMEDALVVYASKHKGRFPERLEDAAKYFPDSRVPVDAWGNPFAYASPAGHEPYVIRSYGRDGRYGGEGAAADIVSWNLADDG